MVIYDYTTDGGKNLIEDYIDKLPPREKLKVHEAREEIRYSGFDALEKLHTRQLRGKLWEIKITQTRIMYVVVGENGIAILHICKKQKHRAERKELETAISRAKELGVKI